MMKMIDVMKRLAELDAQNPSIVKENADLAECGMMPEMGMGAMEKPSTPASINMTAGSADELGNLLKDIVSLAGMNKVEPEQLGVEPAPMSMSPEPAIAISGGSPADDMRSVIDKLHPDTDDGEGGDEPAGDNPFAGNDAGDEKPEDDEEETDEGEYDNSPAGPEPTEPFSANQFSNNENKPGQGDRMDGDRPKAYADMNEAAADLFAQYKQFVNEN